MEDWMIYYNAAELLADIAPDDGVGAIGSNWQQAASREAAEQFLAECLREGFSRGHNHNPRF